MIRVRYNADLVDGSAMFERSHTMFQYSAPAYNGKLLGTYGSEATPCATSKNKGDGVGHIEMKYYGLAELKNLAAVAVWREYVLANIVCPAQEERGKL